MNILPLLLSISSPHFIWNLYSFHVTISILFTRLLLFASLSFVSAFTCCCIMLFVILMYTMFFLFDEFYVYLCTLMLLLPFRWCSQPYSTLWVAYVHANIYSYVHTVIKRKHVIFSSTDCLGTPIVPTAKIYHSFSVFSFNASAFILLFLPLLLAPFLLLSSLACCYLS